MKLSEGEADHSLPSSAEFKNGWKYNCLYNTFPQNVQWGKRLLRLLTAVMPEIT